MRKNIFKPIQRLLHVFALALLTTSCKETLDVEVQDKLDQSKSYQTLADADAAVWGVYGKFLGLAKQYVILNELRGDLMDVTNNADPYLRELSSHNVSADNPYADPRPFYEVILYCNDVLKNFNKMKDESRISIDNYNKRYSDIASLRSWLYLQLGIQYGNVPYLTKPIENIDELKTLDAYEKIPFDALLDSLINFTSALPYQDTYAYPTGTSLIVSADNNSSRKFFVTKPILLGDLYLWKGNYLKAAENYKRAMDAEISNSNDLNSFRISNFASNPPPFNVSVSSTANGIVVNESLTTGWRSIFALTNTNANWNTEWYWALPYSSAYKPGNPFIELFSYSYGKYLLKPSKLIIDKWSSNSMINGTPFDARRDLSTDLQAGNYVITKHTDNSASTLTNLNRGGQWNIWRAAGVHLKYSEAANRLGYTKIGWALLNLGIANTFSPDAATNLTPESLERMRTPYPEPFYFDARSNTSAGLRREWSRNQGIRGRAGMTSLDISLQTDVEGLEDKLIEEASFELAFEGNRWADLLRIARRKELTNGTGKEYLKEVIASKFRAANLPVPAGVDKLGTSESNWYLPFK